MHINQEKLNKEAPGLGIKLIVLFGSQASGTANQESDYDVAVLTDSDKKIDSGLKRYSEIMNFVLKVLNIPDEKLDLTNLNEANPLLKYHILHKGTLLYGNELLFHEEQAVSFREYHDSKKLFDLEKYLVHQKQKYLNKQLS